ncbi:hypothetical protein CGRA01v4_00336 [Colletotrichum graminicola]|nr:hypothetical protein CGRA01v4_00336 [Colletotrichum graminicola]
MLRLNPVSSHSLQRRLKAFLVRLRRTAQRLQQVEHGIHSFMLSVS